MMRCAAAATWMFLIALSGCPLEAPNARGTAAAAGGSGAATAGRPSVDVDAIRKQIDGAGPQLRLPEPPSEETLCKLKFSVEEYSHAGISLGEARALIAAQGSEAQSASEAGLQYRFSDGTGLSLRFTWRHKWCRSPRNPPNEHACKASGENVPDDYYLMSGDRQGAPYPRCWPHKDPSDD